MGQLVVRKKDQRILAGRTKRRCSCSKRHFYNGGRFNDNEIPDHKYNWKEAAGIYDVMENRAQFFTGKVESSWFQKSGIYGFNKGSSLAVRNYRYDGKGLEFKDDNGNPDRIELNKLEIVTRGVIAGMMNPNGIIDYAGGGTTWHGNDFRKHTNGSTAYRIII